MKKIIVILSAIIIGTVSSHAQKSKQELQDSINNRQKIISVIINDYTLKDSTIRLLVSQKNYLDQLLLIHEYEHKSDTAYFESIINNQREKINSLENEAIKYAVLNSQDTTVFQEDLEVIKKMQERIRIIRNFIELEEGLVTIESEIQTLEQKKATKQTIWQKINSKIKGIYPLTKIEEMDFSLLSEEQITYCQRLLNRYYAFEKYQ